MTQETPRIPIQDASDFVERWFANVPADDPNQMVVCTDTKTVLSKYSPSDLEKLAQDIVEHNPQYFRVALMDPSMTKPQGGKEDSRLLPAICLDVDANKDGHGSRKDVLKAIKALPIEPHLLVNTRDKQGGFHVWWVLDVPADISTPEGYDAIAGLMASIRASLIDNLAPLCPGMNRESLIDDKQIPCRLMRIPGTTRTVDGAQVKVTLRWSKKGSVSLFQLLNAYPSVAKPEPSQESLERLSGDESEYTHDDAGTHFNRSQKGVEMVAELMQEHGHQVWKERDHYVYKHAMSLSEESETGTIGKCKSRDGGFLVTCFSDSMQDLEKNESGHTLHYVYAQLEHDGVLSAAAAELYEEGFGKQKSTQNEAAQNFFDNLLSEAKPSPEVDTIAGKSPEEMKKALQEYYERMGMPQPCTSDELAVRDTTVDYIIPGVLAKDHPAFIAGFEKSLKTTIGADMAYSIATKTPFLSHQEWLPTTALKVHFFSAESGDATLKETFERIANRRNKRLADAGSNLTFSFNVPNAADPKALAIFETELAMYRPDVVIVDPVYFILSGDSDNNRSKFIHEFEKVTQIVKKYCATLVAIDHTNKSASSGEFEFRVPRLTDMNGTGRSSFARSWILTKRRSSYQHGKPHELYLSLGGSCLGVHGGRDYAVDIDETPDADEHDRGVRHYEVTMFEPLGKWQKEAKEARDIKKYEEERDEQNEIKRKIQQNIWDAQKEGGDDFKGLTYNKASEGVGACRTSKKCKKAWEAMNLPTGPVEEIDCPGKTQYFRLKPEVFEQGRPEDYEISLDVEGDIEFESITLG